MTGKTGKYELYKDAKGEYRWRFKASNGNIIAVSSESYHKKSDCRHGIDLVKASADAPVDDQTGE